jgi:hypothetical protein
MSVSVLPTRGLLGPLATRGRRSAVFQAAEGTIGKAELNDPRMIATVLKPGWAHRFHASDRRHGAYAGARSRAEGESRSAASAAEGGVSVLSALANSASVRRSM